MSWFFKNPKYFVLAQTLKTNQGSGKYMPFIITHYKAQLKITYKISMKEIVLLSKHYIYKI